MRVNIQKLLAIGILFILISYSLINLQPYTYAGSNNLSSDISGIDTNKYPGIKESIQELQKQFPNWKFKILYTGLSWDDVIKNEDVGHGGSPKSLIYYTYTGEWRCPTCGDQHYDNGSWRHASEKAIGYLMDPRNILNGVNIFQFEDLTSSNSNVKVVKNMTKGTFLEGHEQGIVDVGNQYGVSAYYIVARLIQEQGKGGSELVSGNSGYYNAFNIGASGADESQVIANGIAYAKKKGWDTLEKSISGGIEFVATNYIKKGQNTLYLQKFNVTSNSTYANQYQQNVTAPQTEGATLRDTYIDIDSYNSEHTFIIPVYENMPKEPISKPNGGSTPTSSSELVRVNVNNSLKIRKSPTDSTLVDWLWKDEICVRLEKGTEKINGTYWDKVLKSNGMEGYTARETFDYEDNYKLYLVPINTSDNSGSNDEEKIKIDKESKIITVVPGTIVQDIIDVLGDSTKIIKQDKTVINDKKSKIGTGYIVNDTYTVIKKGDANNDGIVNSFDYIRIMNYIMKKKKYDNYQKEASDANNDGKVDSFDYIRVMNYIMGTKNIEI